MKRNTTEEGTWKAAVGQQVYPAGEAAADTTGPRRVAAEMDSCLPWNVKKLAQSLLVKFRYWSFLVVCRFSSNDRG
jgi:hypothetical protein